MHPTPIPTDPLRPRPLAAAPGDAARVAPAPAGLMPRGAYSTGCSGVGAASAIRQWQRQHEERERGMTAIRPGDVAPF
ncbi:MAG: hypothetical protein RIS88_530 [Pseudomonadota bacterium]|jgi:hypothetical protein